MWNFPVCTLVFGDELKRRARRGEVSLGVERERSPKGVATKKPSKSGTLAGSRSAIAGHKAGAEIRVRDQPLNGAYSRPIVCLLELRVWQVEVHGAQKIIGIVLCRFFFGSSVIGDQILVSAFRFSPTVH